MAYKSALVNKQTSLPAQANKTLITKSTHIMHKTVSVRSVPVKKPKCTGETMLYNASNKSLLSNREQELKDFEVSGVFDGKEWTGKTLSEKNQWVKKFLVKTKSDVVYVYNQVGEIMKSPSNGDLVGDITTMTQISSANCLESIELQRLKELRKDDQAELAKRNRTIKDLMEILNKNTCTQDMQTCGTNVEEIEKTLSDVSTEFAEFRDSSNDRIDGLTRDLAAKNEEFEELSGNYSSLQSEYEHLYNSLISIEGNIFKVNEYNKTIKQDNTILAKIINKYQLKFENINKQLEETHRKLIEKTMIADRIRLATDNHEVIYNIREGEFEELENEIRNLKETIEDYKETMRHDEREIKELKNTVGHYRADIHDVKRKMEQQEKIIKYMINQAIRDEQNKNELLTEQNKKISLETRERMDDQAKMLKEEKSLDTVLKKQNEKLENYIEEMKSETVQRNPWFFERFFHKYFA